MHHPRDFAILRKWRLLLPPLLWFHFALNQSTIGQLTNIKPESTWKHRKCPRPQLPQATLSLDFNQWKIILRGNSRKSRNETHDQALLASIWEPNTPKYSEIVITILNPRFSFHLGLSLKKNSHASLCKQSNLFLCQDPEVFHGEKKSFFLHGGLCSHFWISEALSAYSSGCDRPEWNDVSYGCSQHFKDNEHHRYSWESLHYYPRRLLLGHIYSGSSSLYYSHGSPKACLGRNIRFVYLRWF